MCESISRRRRKHIHSPLLAPSLAALVFGSCSVDFVQIKSKYNNFSSFHSSPSSPFFFLIPLPLLRLFRLLRLLLLVCIEFTFSFFSFHFSLECSKQPHGLFAIISAFVVIFFVHQPPLESSCVRISSSSCFEREQFEFWRCEQRTTSLGFECQTSLN